MLSKKIKSIKKIGKHKTYDLTVRDNNNFFLSNGLLSHNSDDLLIVCEMPSQASREVTLSPLKQDKRITQYQISYIGWKIQIHEVCIIERGKKARILKRIQPPRTLYWKSEYGDFMSLWRKENPGLLIDKSIFLEKIMNEIKDRKTFLTIPDKHISKEEVVVEIEEEFEKDDDEEKLIENEVRNEDDIYKS